MYLLFFWDKNLSCCETLLLMCMEIDWVQYWEREYNTAKIALVSINQITDILHVKKG